MSTCGVDVPVSRKQAAQKHRRELRSGDISAFSMKLGSCQEPQVLDVPAAVHTPRIRNYLLRIPHNLIRISKPVSPT